MSFKVGIIGLPNAGKSTLFKAITKKEVLIASYPFSTIEPNVGIAEVADKRLKKIVERIKPEKVVPATLEFIDIAGLIEGSHKGEGLGNQFLSHISACDALVHVIGAFQRGDPEKDKETVQKELRMKDIQITDNLIEKARKKEGRSSKELKRLEDTKKKMEEEIPLKEPGLLSAKPVIYLYNTSRETEETGLVMDLKTEEELTDLSNKEKEELGLSSSLDHLVKECYNSLNLITFFTVVGGKKVQSWALERGENILSAAEKVHSDFKEKFIRAEIISYTDFLDTNSLQSVREEGKVKTGGREYIVQDGDIIEFKI